MMDIDLLKWLCIVKGRINEDKVKKVLEESDLRYVGVKENEEIQLLKEYIRRRWKVGGRRVEEYVKVLKKIRGVDEFIRDSLGEKG